MRTTIRIDDDLYRRAKSDAARSGRTVGELIEDAVRKALEAGSAPTAAVADLPVYGGSGTMPGVELNHNQALRDLMDAPPDALH